MSRRRSNRRARRIRRFLKRLLILILVIAALYGVFLLTGLKTVIVTGNIHNTPSEVTEILISRPTAGNTILAWLMNKNRKIDQPGFIESIDAKLVDRSTLKVTVNERRFVGRVKKDDVWWYFNSSGEVQAAAKELKEDGVPPVEGLELQGSPGLKLSLPIANTRVFSMLTMLMNRTDANSIPVPDRVVFAQGGIMSLVYGRIEVILGNGEKLEMRLKEFAGIWPELSEEKAGILHLENFDGSQRGIVFDKTE